jgi:hypothetical protein
LNQKHILLVCFCLHFLLILTISSRDTFSALAQGHTLFPKSLDSQWQQAEVALSTALGEQWSTSNPVRQAITIYTHAAGIEAGYGFFAPNVPNSYKLVFEVHYFNGHVEYELPQVQGSSTGLRLTNLFDVIGHTRYDPLRETLVKMLAYSVSREHPDAAMIRAVFGFVKAPTARDFKQGIKESYEFLYAYDFSFHSSQTDSPKR